MNWVQSLSSTNQRTCVPSTHSQISLTIPTIGIHRGRRLDGMYEHRAPPLLRNCQVRWSYSFQQTMFNRFSKETLFKMLEKQKKIIFKTTLTSFYIHHCFHHSINYSSLEPQAPPTHTRVRAHTPSRPIKAVAPQFNSSRSNHDWQLLAGWRRWQCLRPSTLTVTTMKNSQFNTLFLYVVPCRWA